MAIDNDQIFLTEAISVKGREYTFYDDWCLALPAGFTALTETEDADLLAVSGAPVPPSDYEKAQCYLHVSRIREMPDVQDLLRYPVRLMLEHSILSEYLCGDKDRDFILRRDSDLQIYCQLASFQRIRGGYGFAVFRMQAVTRKGIYAIRMGFQTPAEMQEYQKQLIDVAASIRLAHKANDAHAYLHRFFELDLRLDMTRPPADEGIDGHFRERENNAGDLASFYEMGLVVDDVLEYALCPIEDIMVEAFPLTETARRYAELFRTEESRLPEMYCGFIPEIEQFTALRSFWWCVQEYAVHTCTPIAALTLEDILAIAQLIESRGYCNYDDNYADELCCVPDMNMLYLPDAAFCSDIQQESQLRENILRLGWFAADLYALRTQLEELQPLMEKLHDWLMDTGKPLRGIHADLLYVWCTMTLAADRPFAVTADVPEDTECIYAPVVFDWAAHISEASQTPAADDPIWNTVREEITSNPDVPLNDDTIETLANAIANALRNALQGTPAGKTETEIPKAGISCTEDTIITVAEEWCITIPAGWRYSIDESENGERVLVAGLDDGTLNVYEPFDATVNFSVTNPLDEDLEGYPLDAPEMAATIQRLQMLSGDALTLRSDRDMILNYRFHFRDTNPDGTVWYKHGGFIVTRKRVYAFQMFNKQAKSQHEADMLLENLLLSIRLTDEEIVTLDTPEAPAQAERTLSGKKLRRGERFDISACRELELGLLCGGMEADAFVFLLDKSGKAAGDADLIFYGNPETADGAVSITRKNGVKTICVNPEKVSDTVQKIVLYFSADEEQKSLCFANIPNAAIAVSENGAMLCHLELSDLPEIRTLAAMELYRYHGSWKLRAVGAGFHNEIAVLCEVHGLEVE